jgi:hypothetical protein
MSKDKFINNEINDWLKSDRNYKKGVALYYKHVDNPKRVKIFSLKEEKRLASRLLSELTRLLTVVPLESFDKPSSDETKSKATSDLLLLNLDELKYNELKSLFLRLDLKAEKMNKASVLSALQHYKDSLQ